METPEFTPLGLYERTVQDPATAVEFLLALHARGGGSARVLSEDFAGSAAISRAWVERIQGGSAIATDLDRASLGFAPHPRVATHVLDVRSPELAHLGPCDVVHAGNFSIGELHARDEIVGWARRARARLNPGGIVAVDTYGGSSAWRIGALERRRALAHGIEVRWVWEQRHADPRTAEVVNALSFRVLRRGEVVLELLDAFVYRWRLWSIPELTDVLREVGFESVEAHTRVDGLDPARNERASEDTTSCVALVVGRRAKA